MLKRGEYEIWRMMIEQYIQMIDYALWEVIEKGATLLKTQVVKGVTTDVPITTAEEKAQRILEVKARKIVKQVEQHMQNTHSPRGNQRNWNNMMSQKLGRNFKMFNKAYYVCGSFDHLQVDCNYYQKQFQNQKMVKPIWNNAHRVNHQKFAKKTQSYAKRT
nr:retrotransposon Orf1 [Tanacetum cinerariifolium]